jgi:HPt (histidine-containing phosphotransfer) domain-containing protein/uncharacterized membrane-anchored protein YhcB (DUF1043 family)
MSRWLQATFTSRLERLRAGWREAMRADGSIESKLMLLGVAGLTLFLTLVAALFFVQYGLVGAQKELAGSTLPTEQALGRLGGAIGSAFQRQARISSTVSTDQLRAVRDRAAIERSLAEVETVLRARLAHSDAQARVQSLDAHVGEFLTADAALYASVGKRHQLQGQFEKELAGIDAGLRHLIESAQSISGLLHLEYVLVLRGIARAMHGGSPPADLVRAAVVGNVRGQMDDVSDLVDGVIGLGWLTGKTGLAPNEDVLNSIVANEIAQNRTKLERLIGNLERRAGDSAEMLGRLHGVAEQLHAILPRIADEKRADSLVRLRREVLAEAQRAGTIRQEGIASAQRLTADVDGLESYAKALADHSVRGAARTTLWARLVSLLASVLGIVVCAFAARRIRQSVTSLRATNRELTELKDHLQHVNGNLEEIVDRRTRALQDRDRSMQLVMDSMTEGLLTVDLQGQPRGERSKTMTDWFGTPAAAAPVWRYFYDAVESSEALTFEVGFSQLAEDCLPFEVSAAQMPQQLERAGRTYALEFRPVHEAEQLAAVLIVVRDVTEQIAALHAEKRAREDQKLIGNLLRDKVGFMRMVSECEALIAQVVGTRDPLSLRHALHTIKGNCAIYGFLQVSETAHQLETRMTEVVELSPEETLVLERHWRASLQRLEEFFVQGGSHVEVEERELAQLIERLHSRADYGELLERVEAWRLEPAVLPLRRLGAQATRLAEQLGKQVTVRVEDHGVRLLPDRYSSLWASLNHAVRNALDHGIESPERRRELGKPEAGTLSLSAERNGRDQLVVTIADDGAGVDFERIREVAESRGLPHATREELIAALFCDGVSAKTEVTELSG